LRSGGGRDICRGRQSDWVRGVRGNGDIEEGKKGQAERGESLERGSKGAMSDLGQKKKKEGGRRKGIRPKKG